MDNPWVTTVALVTAAHAELGDAYQAIVAELSDAEKLEVLDCAIRRLLEAEEAIAAGLRVPFDTWLEAAGAFGTRGQSDG
jgi:hypothetical protein